MAFLNAEQGFPRAQYNLGILHTEAGEYDKAAYWFQKAAEQDFRTHNIKILINTNL
ncbi:SEL1-like repeat protein [Desulfolithobacter dissulfuricans]|uniref:SEL1-like repeat protein n=1 Tax=Desulfolithobacter dissulfuricans TaxID=2795293 RepID=UPI00338F810A